MQTKSYLLKNIPENFFRQIKAAAALNGTTIQSLIISIMKKEFKIKPVLRTRAK